MIKVLILSCGLCCGSLGEVSTENIDSYVDMVVKARKACGPTSVWYCLRQLGHRVQLVDLWRESKIEADGTNLQDLLNLLHAHGVSAQAIASDPPSLKNLPVPSILVVDDAHCIVFEGLEPDETRVRYFEPSVGKVRTVSCDEMQRHWTGEAIVFGPPALSGGRFALFGLFGVACALMPPALLHWRKFLFQPAG